MKFRTVLTHLALMAALIVPVPVLAQDTMPSFDDGYAAFEAGDMAEAFRIFHHRALAGDADAQNNIGLMYEGGASVAQDYAEAMRWYRLAAEQGHATALFSIRAIAYGSCRR